MSRQDTKMNPGEDGTLADGISELRSNVLIALIDVKHPLIAVTSPHAGEDRHHISTQLATAVAQTGRQVLLLNADVTLDIETSTSPEPERQDAQLTILTTAAVRSGNAALLITEAFRDDLNNRREQFDIVIVLCPPMLDIPETRAVASICDGTLLVVQHGRSHRDDSARAAMVLDAAGAHPLGAVIHNPR